jgi:hypothetical protein
MLIEPLSIHVFKLNELISEAGLQQRGMVQSLDCDLFSRPADLLPALRMTLLANPLLKDRVSVEDVVQYMVQEMKCADKVDMMPVLVSLLRQKEVYGQDLLLAVNLFCLVVESDPSHRATAGRMGGAEAMIFLIQRRDVLEGVMLSACRALLELTVEYSSAEAVGAAGGVEVLVQLIRAGTSSTNVCVLATNTLRNTVKVGKNRMVAVQHGAIELMVELLQRPAASDTALAAACAVLAELAVEKVNSKRARLTGGVSAVIKVLRSYEKNPLAAKEAIEALRTFVTFDEDKTDDVFVALQALSGWMTTNTLGKLWPPPVLESGWFVLCKLVQQGGSMVQSMASKKWKSPTAEEASEVLSKWMKLEDMCARHKAGLSARMCNPL